MGEFLFQTWPAGAGPMIVQFVLVVAGAYTGVRVIDDVKAWRTAKARRISDQGPPA